MREIDMREEELVNLVNAIDELIQARVKEAVEDLEDRLAEEPSIRLGYVDRPAEARDTLLTQLRRMF